MTSLAGILNGRVASRMLEHYAPSAAQQAFTSKLIKSGRPIPEPAPVEPMRHKPLTAARLAEIAVTLDEYESETPFEINSDAYSLLAEVHRLRRIINQRKRRK